jgi:hypothetical protein
MVKASLPRNPQAAPYRSLRPAQTDPGRNAEGTREPQESRPIGDHAQKNPAPRASAARPPAPGAPVPVEMPKEPKCRRNPGEAAAMTGQARRRAQAPQHPSGWPRGSKTRGIRELHARAQRARSKCRRNPSAAEIKARDRRAAPGKNVRNSFRLVVNVSLLREPEDRTL